MARQALSIGFLTRAFSIMLLCGVFWGATTAQGQYVSGFVSNNSEWENDETLSPPHWYVSPGLGTVSNAFGRIVASLYAIAEDDSFLVATEPLVPTNVLSLVNLASIQGTNVEYELGGSLGAGDYRVVAWIDGNGNWLPDPGEPYGSRDITVSEDSPVENIVVQIEDDTDGDGLEDWWEMHWFGDLDQTHATDFDNDGLTDGEEYDLIQSLVFVEPSNWDTDGDKLDDAWEIFYGLDPTSDIGDDGRFGDNDSDTVINFDEYMGPDGIGWRSDVNGDGIAEYTTSRDAMNPTHNDSDRDGAGDANEFLWDLTHPTHPMSSSNFHPRSLEMTVNGSMGIDMTDPTGSTYAFGDSGGTVEFWIRPGADGDGIIYGFTNSLLAANLPHFQIVLEDYRPRMDIMNGSNIMASVGGLDPDGSVQQLPSNTWTHVACAIAPLNNSLDLYVDGVLLIAQKTFIKPDFVLGRPTICQGFTDGYIDELRIWSYPRASADIEYWSKRIYPAPGYPEEVVSTASGRDVQMYAYLNPRPLIGYFRFDEGGPVVENFAFLNYGLYPQATPYYLGGNATASVTTDQAATVFGSDDADADGLPEWWAGIHNLEQYPEYYSTAYGPLPVPCPDDPTLIQGFYYFRSFSAYGSIGTRKAWTDGPSGTVFYAPKTRPDFYMGDRSSFTRYIYLFSQPLECPLEVFTPGMLSTVIYVNGTRVTTDGDEANIAQAYDVAQYMTLGRNQIHVECESEIEVSAYNAGGGIDSLPYTIADIQAYDPDFPDLPLNCNAVPLLFTTAVGKFDARLTCNGVPSIVRGDQSRADPRALWHCQVWSTFYEELTYTPKPDRENRHVPSNMDFGVPLNAERDNNPLDPDSADDELDAVYEYVTGANPRDRDSDNNGVGDGEEDFDLDGLVNREEQRFGSDPWLPDSDDDGVIDGVDVGTGNPAQSLSPQNNLSVCFGGTEDDFLSFPLQQRFGLGKWTVEGWIRPDADELDGGIVMQRGVSSNSVNYEVGLTTSNTPYARYVSIGGVEVRAESSVPVVADGATWTHLAASYYDRDLTLFVNGTHVASKTGSAFPAIYAGGPLTQHIGRGFKGCIDELRLWKEERTLEEINDHREEVLTGLEENLVAYYRFDDDTSYTNLPPVVGTSANNGTSGLGSAVAWTWGQVEDNVLRYAADWQQQWDHAASFNGDVMFSTNHIIVGPPRLQVFIEPDDAIDAGALWSFNGGATWNDSGYVETRLSPGDYEVSFKDIDDWIIPGVTEVTLARGESTVITGAYVQTASLTVIIDNNNSDVKTFATWSVDGQVNNYGTGTRIDGLAPGVPGYDIIFSDISANVPGWDPPSSIHVELLEGQERTVTAKYTPVSGGLQITFNPATVPAAARWRVSGNSNWFGSGEIVTNLGYGAHTVEYNSIQWWEEPDDEVVSIVSSTLQSLQRTWMKLPEPTSISVLLTPDSAVAAGAQWQFSGSGYNSGDSVLVDPGDYLISFKSVQGFLTPLDVELTVTDGAVMATGVYYRSDILGTTKTGLSSPRGVAASLRYVYVTDAANNRVVYRDTITGVWSTLGTSGTGLGQFRQPLGVAVADNGDVWVADTGNHRIQRWSPGSGSWTAWGRQGSGAGQFTGPYDLDIDDLGNVYVADYHNSRVQRRSVGGSWATLVSGGTQPGKVRYPSGVAIGPNGMLYVSDYDPAGEGQAGRLQKFEKDGTFVSVLGGEHSNSGGFVQNVGVSVAADLKVYVANTHADAVVELPDGGAWEQTIPIGLLNAPWDVEVDTWGNLYVSDTGNGRVLKFPATDSDGDGAPDAVETTAGTMVAVADSDGDGYDDGHELLLGTDPLNPADFPSARTDFDGDGISDFGCYDAAGIPGLVQQGQWYFMKSTERFDASVRFGYGGTVPVVGDFDGDGLCDYGCYDAAGIPGLAPPGSWYFMRSTAGFGIATFGYMGTVPVVGDFDGDGVDDYGCYDDTGIPGLAAQGSWYFMMSTAGFVIDNFGYGGTVPVVGDFDGDGTDDYGCYDDAGISGVTPPGSWYFMKSTAGFSTDTFGYGGTVPVVGDFDGDGVDDYGCYDAAGIPGLVNPGQWYFRRSTAGFGTVGNVGHSGAVPVVGDYDGDGKDDLGTYDDTGLPGVSEPGSWLFFRSTLGRSNAQFGYGGTAPVTGDPAE